jgi:protein tyrosine/serine phosphatase
MSVYITGPNFLTSFIILIGDKEITKSGVPQLKIIICLLRKSAKYRFPVNNSHSSSIFYLNKATTKIKTFTKVVLEETGYQVVNNTAVFEELEEVNRYKKSSFKPSLCCSTCRPARDLTASIFSILNLTTLTHATSGQDRACSLSTALKKSPSRLLVFKII